MDELVNKYLRKYINGFSTRDIKSLRADCEIMGVSYSKVIEKLSLLEDLYR